MSNPNTSPVGAKPPGAPKMEVPQAIRDVADKGLAQARASYEKMSATTTEASRAMEKAHSTTVQGAIACNAKIVEFAHVNNKAAFDYVARLFAAKSPTEFIEVSADHARNQFEVVCAQSKELAALSQKAMLEAVEPLKASAAKMFQAPLA